jgi:fibronectin-binding autotransporter adhesin
MRAASIVLAAGAALSASMFASRAQAQYVWTGGTTGTQNFTDATRWLPGNVPAVPATNVASTTLTFSPGASSAAVTATNNNATPIATPFQVNGMTFNNMSMANAFTVAGTANNVFQLTGQSPTLTLQGSGNSVISATGAALQLIADTTIGGSGMGGLTINSVISDDFATSGIHRALTIANTAPTPFASPVMISGTNTFSGGLVLDGGILGLASTLGQWGPKGSSVRVTSNGGTLALANSPNAVTSSTLQLDAGGTLRVIGGGALILANSYNATLGTMDFNNKLAGSGDLLYQGTSNTGIQVASDSSAYTGVVTVDRSDLPSLTSASGGIQLKSGSHSGTPVTRSLETGNLLGVDTFNLRNGGQLTMSNGVANEAQSLNRIKDTATFNLASAQLNLVGCATTSVGPGSTGTTVNPTEDTTETVGPVNGAGYSFLQIQPGTLTTSSSVLTIASLNRVDRGTFLVRGQGLGNGTGAANAGNLTITTAPTALVGGAGTWSVSSTDTNIKILPYAVGGITNTDTGSTFLTLSGTSIKPLTTAQYATTLGVNADDNVRLTAATANNAIVTLNSLVIASNGAADGSVTGSGTLNITSGAILAATTNASTGTSISNNIAFGTAEGHVNTPSTGGLTISGNMTGSNGFTKSGAGSNNNTLFLTGDNSGLQGTLTLNAGPIDFNSANALPGTGQIVTNGATSGTTGASTGLNYSGATPYTLTRDIAANTGWVTFKSINTGGAFTIAGQITGAAGVSLQSHINGSGVSDADIWLTNAGNSYTGPTRISTGTTHIYSDSNLGNGGAVGLEGVLKLEGNWTSSRTINVNGGTIDTNGNTATLSGPMINYNSSGGVNNNAQLTKLGAGTLNITGNANALGGAINVNGGTLLVNGTIAGSTANAITATLGSTLGGTGMIWRSITLGSGITGIAGSGTLAPGNSGPGILTEYGNLLFTAANTGSSGNPLSNFAVDLNGPIAGSGYDQMVVNAASTNAAGTVTLNSANLVISLGYFPSASDTFFILTKDGTGAISGTFNGLTEGATVSLGTWGSTPVTATISYLGDSATGTIGAGNDVVLYNIVPAPGAAALLGLAGLTAARRRRTA